MFEKLLKWYEMGLWSKKMIEEAHEKGIINLEQLNKILSIKN